MLSPDGARVLLTRSKAPGVEVRALDDGRIVLVSWPDLRETGTLAGHGSKEIRGLAFSRDASRVVSATAEEILVWANR